MSRTSRRSPAPHGPADPAVAIGLILLGGFLALYLVGYLLIGLGLWLLARSDRGGVGLSGSARSRP